MQTDGGRWSLLPHDPDVELGAERAPRRAGASPRAPAAGVLAAVALGGAVGAFARYALSVALPSVPGRFPWGTLAVNLSGSVAIGFALVLAMAYLPRTHLLRPAVTTGLIGAYTTFSTFAVEAVSLVRDGHAAAAVGYVLLTVGAGLVAAWAGTVAARAVVARGRSGPVPAAAPAPPPAATGPATAASAGDRAGDR